MIETYRLRCEREADPVGIHEPRPRLSWSLRSPDRLARQSAYRILVEEGGRTLWDSGRVESGAPSARYDGPAPASGRRLSWRVAVWGDDGTGGAWSEAASWEMGLLDPAEWTAPWIEPEDEVDPKAAKPCPYLRAIFDLGARPVARARAYVTARGLYELSVNGTVVGDRVFAPGFTSYDRRLQYQVYPLEGLLVPGENVVGAILGDGWFRGKIGAESAVNVFGTKLALLFMLRVDYDDGSSAWLCPRDGWRTSTGPILSSDLKDGEVYDARLEMPGWDRLGFDDSAWRRAREADLPKAAIAPSLGPPTRRKERFAPRILRTPKGATVLDMGQNFAGRLRMRVRGPAGARVRLVHGETLDQAGEFTMANLSFGGLMPELKQEVIYTLQGGGEEVYEPRFTYMGFRYVLVEGFPGEIREGDFEGVALYSDLEEAGGFACSDPALSRLHENVLWSMRSNFLEIPTDCPQRERAGWTGDAQIFAPTATFLADSAGFFSRWLADLAACQRPSGMVPNLVPDPTRLSPRGMIAATNGSAGWGDAAVILPWVLYQCYGDESFLEAAWPSMRAWVDYAISRSGRPHWTRLLSPGRLARGTLRAEGIWDRDYHWGEWLEPGASLPAIIFQNFVLSQPSVATAFLAYSSGILAEAARVLGRDAEARRYAEQAELSRGAWVREFARDGGARLAPDRQATYVRALAFGLLPEEMRPRAAGRLAELVREGGYHVGTGFLATPFLCRELSRAGHLDIAYRVLLERTRPSWLYEVERGATTVWESWDVVKEDGSVGIGSLNHYSPGAVATWLHETVAGLGSAAPGYARLALEPRPGGGLSSASAWHETPRGRAECGWELSGGEMRVAVLVPPGATASLRLPAAQGVPVAESGRPAGDSAGLRPAGSEGGDALFDLGSGRYRFAYHWRG